MEMIMVAEAAMIRVATEAEASTVGAFRRDQSGGDRGDSGPGKMDSRDDHRQDR